MDTFTDGEYVTEARHRVVVDGPDEPTIFVSF